MTGTGDYINTVDTRPMTEEEKVSGMNSIRNR